jgi:hypothetical protein
VIAGGEPEALLTDGKYVYKEAGMRIQSESRRLATIVAGIFRQSLTGSANITTRVLPVHILLRVSSSR